MCNCISHHATLHVMPLCWWLHCALCHGIFMPCKGMPWQCSWGCGNVFCSMALCIVPQHGSLCCSLALHTAAFSCHGVMLRAMAFLQVLRHFASCSGIALHTAAYWKWRCASSNSTCAVEFCQKKENQSSRGDVFCSAALCIMPQHGSLCCSLALHAAAFLCHGVMLRAMAFCRC